MAKKTSKVKSTTVDYIVDMRGIESAQDAYLAFALAKINAHLTQPELDAFIDAVRPKFYIMYGPQPAVIADKHTSGKKPNIFKRVWNWITGK